MTSRAQQALRRTLEGHSSSTSFAFACDQSNKIIELLQSRWEILRYSRPTDEQVVQRLMAITKAEDIKWATDGAYGIPTGCFRHILSTVSTVLVYTSTARRA